jgi:hypothetical protein
MVKSCHKMEDVKNSKQLISEEEEEEEEDTV